MLLAIYFTKLYQFSSFNIFIIYLLFLPRTLPPKHPFLISPKVNHLPKKSAMFSASRELYNEQ